MRRLKSKMSYELVGVEEVISLRTIALRGTDLY